MKRFLSWSWIRLPLSFLFVTLLAGLSEGRRLAAGPPSPAPPSPGGTAVKPGSPPDLAVFFAGEVMGWTEPCG